MLRPITAILLAAFAGLALAAEPVAVQLRGRVELCATQARLADVADLSGDLETIARLGPIPVQELFGANEFSIDAAQVRRVLAAQAPGIVVRVAGAARAVQARRTIPVEAQVKAAATLVTAPGDDTRVSLVRASGPLVVGDDGEEPDLRAESLDPAAAGEIPVRIRVMHGDREEARGLVVIQVRRFRTVAVAAADVPRGQPITAADVLFERVEISRSLTDPVERGEDAVGLVAGRDLAVGTILRRSQLTLPLAVRPGQAVALMWRNGAVELSVAAECLAAGRVGDLVTVRRQSDGQVVRGAVEAPGIVAIVR